MTNQPGYQPGPAAPAPLNPSDEKLWASLAHFGNILGVLPSLLIFLILKDRSAKVAVEAKEALNWIITVAIAVVVLEIISAVVTATGGVGSLVLGGLIGFVVFAVVVVNIVFSIIGGIRVNQGGSYRYPFGLRLIK